MYIKALEQHAMAMRETFARTEKERDELAKENRMLKELLLKNGITYDLAGNVREWTANAAEGGLRFILGGSWRSPLYRA